MRQNQLRRELVAAMRLRRSIDGSHASRPSLPVASRQSRGSISIAGVPRAARILSICDYDGLRLARELLLNQEGYIAESHSSVDSLDTLDVAGFRLAILCQSVAQKRAVHIAEMLHRNNSGIQVMRLSRWQPAGDPCFDFELDSHTEPGKLLEFIREAVLRGRRRHLSLP